MKEKKETLSTFLQNFGKKSKKEEEQNPQPLPYRMLNIQINPHFFYNTLNGMIALNRMGEKKKLEKTILNLAELVRYSSGNEQLMTLEEECEMAEKYLELENLKYSDRIVYEFSMEKECQKRKIPRLLFQPILENCLVHGMDENGSRIKITVSISSVGEKKSGTKIVIRDNGVGFDEKTVSWRSGIKNVKKRAELFDSRVSFRCHSKLGEGTETIFVFAES